MSDLKSGLFLFGLSLFVLWESLRLGVGTLREPGTGFISLCTGAIMALLTLALAYQGWRKRGLRKAPPPRPALLAMAVLITYSLVLGLLGFFIATFLLVGIFFRLGGVKRPWWALIAMSLVVTSLAYYLFGVLLRVYLPRGFLGI